MFKNVGNYRIDTSKEKEAVAIIIVIYLYSPLGINGGSNAEFISIPA